MYTDMSEKIAGKQDSLDRAGLIIEGPSSPPPPNRQNYFFILWLIYEKLVVNGPIHIPAAGLDKFDFLLG